MKLLVIAKTLSDFDLAASYRIINILDYLLRKGVSIIAYTSKNEISKTLLRYKTKFTPNVIEDSKNHFFIRAKNRLLETPDPDMRWGNLVVNDVLKNYDRNSFDAVFVSSPPHSLQIAGMKIAIRYKIPYFADLRDAWIGNHRLRYLTPFHKYLSYKEEKLVFKNAHFITHAIPLVAQENRIRYRNYANKIHILTNGFPNYMLTYNKNKNTINYERNAIAYFGGSYNGFVIKKLDFLRTELIKIGLSKRWMIVTGGPFKIPYNNDYVWKHYGLIPQNRVYDYIYNATIQLSLLPPGDLYPSKTIPLKLYSQITTKGACVFIGNKGATNELFKNIKGIYFFGANGWERLALWIKENENRLTSDKYSRNNIEIFNYDYIGNKLLELMLGKLNVKR